MILRRLNYVAFYLRLTTFLLPTFAFAVAAYVRFRTSFIPPATATIDPGPYVGLLLLTTLIWSVSAEQYGLTDLKQLFAAQGKTRKVVLACGSTYLVVMATTFFYRHISFSRLFVSLSAAALFFLLIVVRLTFRLVLDRKRQTGRNCVRVLIVGADDCALRVGRSLTTGQVMPCALAGFVRLPGQEVIVSGAPVFDLDNINKIAADNGIDDVVIALCSDRMSEIPKIISHLERLCVPIRTVLDFGENVFIHDQLLDFGGILMLDLHSTPAESLPYVVSKRVFDILFSLGMIVLTVPLMLLITLAIRLTSHGPILFVQDRVGLNGKIFRMYKFRTMQVEKRTETDTRWTTANDSRRTKLGALLRRTNLDELPQFFNVFKGDMSVVGPRPERPYFVQKFLEDVAKYNQRHHLKVGITGWAQVNGWRGDTSIAKRVEHDLYYLRNWSFTFDLQIIFMTVLRMFSSKNAY